MKEIRSSNVRKKEKDEIGRKMRNQQGTRRK